MSISLSITITSLVILACYISSILSKENEKIEEKPAINFIVKQMNEHGENEIRISYNKLKAVEVTSPKEGENGLQFGYLTNGKKVITSAHKSGNMIDCDITWGNEALNNFYEKFYHKNVDKKVTVEGLAGRLPKAYYHLMDFHSKENECHEFHRYENNRNTKNNILAEENFAADNNYRQINFTNEATAAGYDIPATTQTTTRRRSKRSTFIYPGTKWCGNGNVADAVNDLGENAATDKCCRIHDHCPLTIAGFNRKYGLMNYRFHTLSHCHCDDQFRKCLKNIDTSVANMVGDLFFNIIKTDCFRFEIEKQCVGRSYFGTCLKYVDKLTANTKESLGY